MESIICVTLLAAVPYLCANVATRTGTRIEWTEEDRGQRAKRQKKNDLEGALLPLNAHAALTSTVTPNDDNGLLGSQGKAITCSIFGPNRCEEHPDHWFCSNCDHYDTEVQLRGNVSRPKRYACQANHTHSDVPTHLKPDIYRPSIPVPKVNEVLPPPAVAAKCCSSPTTYLTDKFNDLFDEEVSEAMKMDNSTSVLNDI